LSVYPSGSHPSPHSVLLAIKGPLGPNQRPPLPEGHLFSLVWLSPPLYFFLGLQTGEPPSFSPFPSCFLFFIVLVSLPIFLLFARVTRPLFRLVAQWLRFSRSPFFLSPGSSAAARLVSPPVELVDSLPWTHVPPRAFPLHPCVWSSPNLPGYLIGGSTWWALATFSLSETVLRTPTPLFRRACQTSPPEKPPASLLLVFFKGKTRVREEGTFDFSPPPVLFFTRTVACREKGSHCNVPLMRRTVFLSYTRPFHLEGTHSLQPSPRCSLLSLNCRDPGYRPLVSLPPPVSPWSTLKTFPPRE